MSGHDSSPRARAEHYRTLAGLISDERAHNALLDMARELDEEAARANSVAAAAPVLRSFS